MVSLDMAATLSLFFGVVMFLIGVSVGKDWRAK